jgi:hypothetical protein
VESQRQFLIGIGFEVAGAWVLRDGALDCDLTCHADRSDVLYAFVAGHELKYIGRTVKTLRWRMSQYKRPGLTQRTNSRVNPQIRELLAQRQGVEVFALVDQEPITYRGVRLSLAGGLEGALIARLNPPWNQMGVRVRP